MGFLHSLVVVGAPSWKILPLWDILAVLVVGLGQTQELACLGEAVVGPDQIQELVCLGKAAETRVGLVHMASLHQAPIIGDLVVGLVQKVAELVQYPEAMGIYQNIAVVSSMPVLLYHAKILSYL